LNSQAALLAVINLWKKQGCLSCADRYRWWEAVSKYCSWGYRMEYRWVKKNNRKAKPGGKDFLLFLLYNRKLFFINNQVKVNDTEVV